MRGNKRYYQASKDRKVKAEVHSDLEVHLTNGSRPDFSVYIDFVTYREG